MARGTFGGSSSDFVYQQTSGGFVRLAAATLTFWTAETGGTQHTDLLLNGSAVSSIPVGVDGKVPTFQGPDGVVSMWASAGDAARVRVVDLGNLDTTDGAVTAVDGNPASQLRVQQDARLKATYGLYVNVRDKQYAGGAKGDGTTDDRAAIQAAIDAAVTAGGGTVFLPAGTYLITSTQRTTATGTAAASDGHALVVAGSNVRILGAGRNRTKIVHKGYGNVNPATTWQNVGGNLWRGGGFYVRSGSSSLIFDGFEMDGSTNTTGDHTWPANITTGNGWDITHKAIWHEDSGTFDRVEITNCRLHGYRGEIIQNNGNNAGRLTIRNCELYDTNGNGFSGTANIVFEDNYIHDAAGYGVEITYAATPQIYRRNHVKSCIQGGMVFLPYASGSVGPLVATDNLIELCQVGGIAASTGLRNARIEGNTIIDCGTGSPSRRAFLVQSAAGQAIKDVLIRRNQVWARTLSQQATDGTFLVKDVAAQGMSNISIEDNEVALTAEGVAAVITIAVPYGFDAGPPASVVIRNNRGRGTTYLYTDQTMVKDKLITGGPGVGGAGEVIAQRRPDRLTNFLIHIGARGVTAATSVTLWVVYYDAAGTSHTVTLHNASVAAGGVATPAPVFITARGNSESEYVSVYALVNIANQAYISAHIQELG